MKKNMKKIPPAMPTKERMKKGRFISDNGIFTDMAERSAITSIYLNGKLGTRSAAIERLQAAERFGRDYMLSEFFPLKSRELFAFMNRSQSNGNIALLNSIGRSDIILKAGKHLGASATALLKALLFEYRSLNEFFKASRILDRSAKTYAYYYLLMQNILDSLNEFYQDLDRTT